MEFRILGPIEVRDGESVVPLPGAKVRALLAVLLLHRNDVVSSEQLIDDLWGEQPPRTARSALHVFVSRLRNAIDRDGEEPRIAATGGGYSLRAGPDEVDAERFELLLKRSRTEGEAAAATTLREALALWHGRALADVAYEPFAQAPILRLEELRLVALEERLDADLALGRHEDVIGELEALVQKQPVRERPRAQLMLALYRAGRQADALDIYARTHETLREELGLEPGVALGELQQAILRHDPSLGLAGEAAGTPLPAAPTPFVGRDAELAQLAEFLHDDSVRLVTLTGPGGIGKTRLATMAARAAADAFTGGVAYVALADVVDVSLVVPAICAAVGVHEVGGAPDALLARHLRDRSVLVVLDNLEQLLGAAPHVSALLAAAPATKAIVTSRSPLHIAAEQEFPVPPLEEAHAVDLFVQRAQAKGRGFALSPENAAAVAEICRRLEGLPLAVELAAAHTPVLPPPAILERLARGLALLETGPRDAPARHRTLRATIEWSYDLLDDGERMLFARFGVFAGGATLDAVEAICAGGDDTMLATVESLVDKSLLRVRGGGRLYMFDLLREFALERLDESDDVRERHRAYYLALAEAAEPELQGPGGGAWLARLDPERANFRAAIEWAPPDEALRLAGALRTFFRIGGHLAEGRQALEGVLMRSDGPSPERAKALNGAGILAAEQGEYAAAARFFADSLEIARALGDSVRIGAALSNLGNLAFFDQDYERARRLYEESGATHRASGDGRSLAVVVENLGLVHLAEGDLERATALLTEGLELARTHGNVLASISSLNSLARAAITGGDTAAGEQLLDENRTLVREVGDRHAATDTLDTLAALACARGDVNASAVLFGAADGLRSAIGARRRPDHAEWCARWLADARAGLPPDRFAAAYERGRSLDPDEALDSAGQTTATP